MRKRHSMEISNIYLKRLNKVWERGVKVWETERDVKQSVCEREGGIKEGVKVWEREIK